MGTKERTVVKGWLCDALVVLLAFVCLAVWCLVAIFAGAILGAL